jgi:hypothetical protein
MTFILSPFFAILRPMRCHPEARSRHPEAKPKDLFHFTQGKLREGLLSFRSG